MSSYLWLAVTKDKYQLPIAVADSAAELARMLHVKEQTIYGTACHYAQGRYKRPRFIRVPLIEEE